MLTRAKTCKFKPKVFLSQSESSTTNQTLSQPEWFEVMKVIYNSLLKNGTWIFTTLSTHKKSIGFKRIFMVNKNSYGRINKYKEMPVTKRFHQ